MPKVSVIIPNYNHATFLAQRIDSVLNQTFTDFELIILDDASKDNSIEIISRYENDDRISHVVYSNENSGSPFVQWKKGVDLSIGEFIWIAESDDWAEEHFLEELLSILEDNKEIGIVYSDSYVHMENGTISKFSEINNKFAKTTKWNDDYITFDEEMNWLAFFCTINNVSSVLFRREALQSVEIPLNFRFMGDWFVYMQIVSMGWGISYTSKILNNYRSHSNNTTKQSEKSLQYVYERFYFVDYLLKKYKHHIEPQKLKQNLFNFTIDRIHSLSDIYVIYKRCVQLNISLTLSIVLKYTKIILKKVIKSRLKRNDKCHNNML